ncbi:RE1-silencing transcription factor [Ascaphus truei]|uniref:RE1-silencing transcription factor n=1 Tax=Ascaphus truei TaxID=8439 RepID=UPI003F5ABE07
MATQVVSQPGGSSLFSNNDNMGIALDGDMYDLHDLSKADLAAPRLIMLANVALTGEVGGSSCEFVLEEERQMAELTTVNNSFSDSDGERMEGSLDMDSESEDSESMELETLEMEKEVECENQITFPSNNFDVDSGKHLETPSIAEDKNKCLKSKPFRCKPCQYKAESEEEFVHHIKIHSAKKFIDNDTQKKSHVKESNTSIPEEADFSKGPIRCDRCGYNTNRFDHYLAHLKHHNKAGENERVYKCTICTYTTVSEYHWKKHLRNHFPRKVYTCSQCSYFSDRKNNYIQHIRTHTGERPYQCIMCPYSSSQKTHLTRHMRTHSGEKPFKCEQCSYVASNQHEVTRHARQVHNGPKPLTCPHCDYKTADRSNFKKHVELHVNPRQFLCPVCDYAASKKCNLQYHIKSRHSGCSDITMDVSKVKLRTKKGEVGILDFTESKQTEKGNTKIKNETEEKKPDKMLKIEKRESRVKNKKKVVTSSVGKVTTRSRRRSATQNKYDREVKTEKNFDKSSKAKCGKRKAVSTSENSGKTSNSQTGTIKKKKLVQKNKCCQEVPTKDHKSEMSQKQKRGKNKENKYFNYKQIKKTSAQSVAKKTKSRKVILEHDGDKDNTHKKQNQIEHDVETPVVVKSLCRSSMKNAELDTQDITTEHLESKEQSSESITEQDTLDNMSTCNNDIASSPSFQQIDIPNILLTEEKNESGTQDIECELEIMETPKINVISEIVVETDESTEHFQCQDKLQMEKADSHRPHDSHSEFIEDETEISSNLEIFEDREKDKAGQTENIESRNILAGSSTPDINNHDPKEVHASQSSCNTSSSESVDIEEDEGIHSHDGSDISDNVSERSDDSGLNGVPSVQETLETKASAALNSAGTNISKGHFVCIFCDRAFREDEEYTKHLKRHLVNVYYLEKATNDQA